MAHLSGTRIGAFARGLTAALLLGTAILSFSPGQPAYAARSISTEPADIDSGGETDTGGDSGVIVISRKVADLRGAGYTCVTVSTGFKECTKTGSTTYWCDASGACEPKPFRSAETTGITTPSGGVLTTAP